MRIPPVKPWYLIFAESNEETPINSKNSKDSFFIFNRREKGLEEREKHIGSALFGFELEGVA